MINTLDKERKVKIQQKRKEVVTSGMQRDSCKLGQQLRRVPHGRTVVDGRYSSGSNGELIPLGLLRCKPLSACQQWPPSVSPLLPASWIPFMSSATKLKTDQSGLGLSQHSCQVPRLDLRHQEKRSD